MINSFTLQKYIDMGAGMMIDRENNLQEIRTRSFPKQSPAVTIVAKIISYIFHPVFVPVMVIWFLLYKHPYLFAGFDAIQRLRQIMMAILMFTFFPLVTVLLLKGLKFIDTIYLNTQRDRVIPFLACMIWYFWIWYVWNNYGKTTDGIDMPREAVQFAFATFLSTILGLMLNIKMKVSLHAISAGIVIAFFILMAFTQGLNFGVWLAIVFFLAGLVCTARFIVSDHTAPEVYTGLFLGILSMAIAYMVG